MFLRLPTKSYTVTMTGFRFLEKGNQCNERLGSNFIRNYVQI